VPGFCLNHPSKFIGYSHCKNLQVFPFASNDFSTLPFLIGKYVPCSRFQLIRGLLHFITLPVLSLSSLSKFFHVYKYFEVSCFGFVIALQALLDA